MTTTPIVDTTIPGNKIVDPAGLATADFQILLESYERVLNGHYLPQFTLATVPKAALVPYATIIVTDAVAGVTLAWSDGTDWLMPATRATLA